MMREPTVSVVVPCFNSAAWVECALDSALSQKGVDVEVVVVDDGSTDNTADILDRYEGRIVRINKTNSGVSDSRRVGVKAATGRYVKFLDSDDVIPQGALGLLVGVANQFPGNAFVGRACEIDEFGEIIGSELYRMAVSPAHLAEMRKEFLLTQATSSSLWFIPRIDVDWDSLFVSGISMGEEYEFCMGMIKNGISIRYCDAIVSHARVHDAPTRLSRTKEEARHIEQVVLIKKSVEFIKTQIPNYSNDAMRNIAQLCWSRGRGCLRMGCLSAADLYFKLALETYSSLQPKGSYVYRLACRMLGPLMAEKMMGSAKFFFSKFSRK